LQRSMSVSRRVASTSGRRSRRRRIDTGDANDAVRLRVLLRR
jgi:hypothetical protein